MLGALRSKQQLMTSSVLNRCWFGELTVRAIQPIGGRNIKEGHVFFISENQLQSQSQRFE